MSRHKVYLDEVLGRPRDQRTVKDVELLRTEGAVYGGCCDRFADNQGCDCMSVAKKMDARNRDITANDDLGRQAAVSKTVVKMSVGAVRRLELFTQGQQPEGMVMLRAEDEKEGKVTEFGRAGETWVPLEKERRFVVRRGNRDGLWWWDDTRKTWCKDQGRATEFAGRPGAALAAEEWGGEVVEV